ncbi:MAG: hypothetical protein KAR79_04205, partial [Simkaniaceae bacterium]|nr:hypothetical protein [Simkaniaceae bacterium]
KAKIDPALFSKIFICPEKNKKPYYKTLFNSFDYLPSDIVVCGDRINIDLTPAKELGFNTVHFRYGRGTGFTGLKRDVDYTISSLCELREVVEFLALKKILVPDPETRYNAGILDTN